jgi:glutathione synthase/RimK-type ligase-like ATP-grasp enzyme
MSTPLVLLATDRDHEKGEPGYAALDAAFAERGVRSRWALWDDPAVDWGEAALVAVRSTWDYEDRLPDFLGWADALGPRLLHGVDVFRWNTDKAYLVELAGLGTVPVVPTEVPESLDDLRAAVARLRPAVVKPRVGAGGRGLVVVRDESWEPEGEPGSWLVQPLVPSVQREGEESVFVIDGRAVSQVHKVAGADDVRVHTEYGGTSSLAALSPEASEVAEAAAAATSQLVGREIVYARIDLLRHEDRLMVSEVEVTEPGLYLDVMPENGRLFADAVISRL